MSTTTRRLQTAATPDDYATVLIDTLAINAANVQSIKDALYHFRYLYLDDGQADEAMRIIAERFDTNRAEPICRFDVAPYGTVELPESAIDNLIRKLLNHQRQVAVTWCIADVKHLRPDLTDEQAWEVLQRCEDKHDCEWGFTWTFIGDVARELFGQAPKTDEAEEE